MTGVQTCALPIYIIDTLRKGVDIHHRAAADYRNIVAVPDIGENGQGIALKARRAVIFVEVECAYQMVTHSPHLLGGRRGGTYWQVTVELSRVGRHYLCAEIRCQLYSESGLARRRRAGYDY